MRGHLQKFFGGLAATCAAATVHQVAAAASSTATAPSTQEQPAVTAALQERDVLWSACERAPCALRRAHKRRLPAEADLARARFEVLELGPKRRALLFRAPAKGASGACGDRDDWSARCYQLLLVGDPGTSNARVVFEGWTGLQDGVTGERSGKALIVGDVKDGMRPVVVADLREDLTLCGRSAELAPQVLHPKTLQLHPAKMQRLSPRERQAAPVLRARPIDGPTTSARLLRVTWATSAVGSPKALTDGQLDTAWAENRGREGRGEFVVMHADPQLPLHAFELVFRPKGDVPANATAPQQLWLATQNELFGIEVPSDAWQQPGAHYLVELPEPVRTDCVALVLGESAAAERQAQVTIAEIAARTRLQARSVEELIAKLDEPEAAAARAMLSQSGEAVVPALVKAYPSLSPQARLQALHVLDAVECKLGLPAYLQAIASDEEQESEHARARIRRCGEQVVDPLLSSIAQAKPQEQLALASELALLAPARSLPVLAALLDTPSAERRRQLRRAVAAAARNPKSLPVLRELLSKQELPQRARIDLLRALTPHLAKLQPQAEAALRDLSAGKPSFRTRYLLLEPAGEMAANSELARQLIGRALASDPSHHVRAQAARVLPNPVRFQRELATAVHDAEVRVREAAVTATRGRPFARDALLSRLTEDPWPIVRAAAASALAQHPVSAKVDAALIAALEDASATVQGHAALALGTRKALAAAEQLRDMVESDDHAPKVRALAATALGSMCDNGSLELLTSYARKLADPLLDRNIRTVATAALLSLARLRPPDLSKRLEPLLDPNAPPGAREAAKRALSLPQTCRQPQGAMLQLPGRPTHIASAPQHKATGRADARRQGC